MMKLFERRRTVVEILEGRTLLSVTFGSTSSTTDSSLLALPGAVQAADIDGDGKTDLVLGVNRSGSTLALSGTDVLLSNGSGGFSIHAGPSFAAGSGTSTNAFAVGALTSGGKPDLIYASQQNNGSLTAQIVPEINNSASGNVSFVAGPTTTITTPTSFNPQQVLIGDFNGDGIPDVAVLGLSAAGESLVVLTGDGSGNFAEAFNTTVTVNNGEQLDGGQMIAGDFNGDGQLDLAVYDPVVGDVTIFVNTSTGGAVTFSQTSTPINLALAGYASGPVVAGDFNSDGKTDLAVAENATSGTADAVAIFLASGSSSADLALTALPAVPAGNPANDQVGALAVADFNNDGHLDLAEDYGVLIGDGAGDLSSPTAALNDSLLSDTQGFNAVVAGNFDGSGKDGLAGVEQTNHSVFEVNQTTPVNPPPPTLTSTTTALSSNENPANFGDKVTFTATVSATSGTAGGYVTFFNGTTELGSVALSNGSASLADSTLSLGDTTVTAKYLGNSSFAASTSSPLTENVLATLPSDSSLEPSLATAKVPASAVIGAKLNLVVPVVIANTSAAISSGRTTVTLSVNSAPTLDGSPVTVAAQTIRNLPVRAGRAVVLHLRITALPGTLVAGTYYLIAAVTDSAGAVSAAAAASTITVAAPFTSINTAMTLVRMPASVVGGQRTAAFAQVSLTNVGNVNYVGPITLTLSASTSQSIPTGTTPFRTLVVKRIGLRPNIRAIVRVPLGINPNVTIGGNYYIIAQAIDSSGNKSNAPSAQTVQIALPVVVLTATITPSVNSVLNGKRSAAAATITITNSGNVAASGASTLGIYASTSTRFSASNPLIESRAVRLAIAPGRTARIRLPLGTLDTLAVGTYFLILHVTGPGVATASATSPTSIAVTAAS